jgi:hypothetical protein
MKRFLSKINEDPTPSIPQRYLIREPGWTPPGHWLWPMNLLDALLRWHDARTQARYERKGY